MPTPSSNGESQGSADERPPTDHVLITLRSLSDPEAVSSMTRFGIKGDKAFGVSVPALRKLSKRVGKDHALAQELWDSGLHEARELATMIADPKQVTQELMERWVKDIDSWDVCDHCYRNRARDSEARCEIGKMDCGRCASRADE